MIWSWVVRRRWTSWQLGVRTEGRLDPSPEEHVMAGTWSRLEVGPGRAGEVGSEVKSEEDSDHIDLLISAGGERFVHADFGMEDLPNLDYHIVDVTPEGQVGN